MKKCRVCGSENEAADFFCRHCGSEIGLAAARADPTASSTDRRPVSEGADPSTWACAKCGQANEAVFSLCTQCGLERGVAPRRPLFLLIGADRFECRPGDVLGREGTVAGAYFSAIGTVSRKHVSLIHREGGWFVVACPGVPNVTQLDGRELASGENRALTGEHVLRLSTQCEVRLKLGEAASEKAKG